jgi:Protein of unknown function (DUF1214)/FtsX-like permease family
MYWRTNVDGAGDTLSGEHDYIMHFSPEGLPPNDAFWSLTMADAKERFVANPVGAVQRLVIGQGMALTLIAVVLGLAAAWAVARFSASILYGVQPHDLVTFTVAPLFLAAVALLACWVPARRATSVDPLTALRHE